MFLSSRYHQTVVSITQYFFAVFKHHGTCIISVTKINITKDIDNYFNVIKTEEKEEDKGTFVYK